MFCSHWFITLFAYTLPFDHLLRVWDVLFLEGPKIIFRWGTSSIAWIFTLRISVLSVSTCSSVTERPSGMPAEPAAHHIVIKLSTLQGTIMMYMST